MWHLAYATIEKSFSSSTSIGPTPEHL